ncbi:phage tail family protein, partial [Staphylococcus pseudintermedius]|nr:phage tail family protein [Staphylococcus pseudintermedius]
IVEVRALQNSNYYMISKGDEDYFMIGDDDLDKPLKDYSPLILEDEARSFSGWNKQNTIDFTDNQTGGKVGGSFSQSSSKESFILNNDSVSGSGWNGAMYKRSFSKQAQDFTTTVKIGVGQKNKGAVRFAQYIYDSDNRVIASIGYTNPNAKQAIGTIIVTLFDQSGNQQTIYKYKNNPRLYKLDDFVVYIRLTRKDDVFTVKSWKYKEFPYPLRKKAFDEHERQFVDGGNFYQRPVVALSLYSAKNGNNNVMPLYIFGTYTRELLSRPTNARDMIIKKGDLITIDMATKNVLVNEESFLSEKTFGSNYFNVDKGHTELVINPPGIFDTTVKWQDRFL